MADKKQPASSSQATSRSIASLDVALLWGRARAMCSQCRDELILDAIGSERPAVIGEMAHIVGHSDKGPRPDPSFPKEQRNKYENLILLCRNHHAAIDKQDSIHSVEDLRTMKADHERWVSDQTRSAVPGVGFAELDVVTKALVGAGMQEGAGLHLLEISQKVSRNGLTDQVRWELSLLISKAREVEDFVVGMGKLDSAFPERLKAGFVREYERLVADGVSGDALFEAMSAFASAGHRAFRLQAAGRIVLAYLFEKCEVFER